MLVFVCEGMWYGRSGWGQTVMRIFSLFAFSTRPNACSGTLPLELTSLRMKSCERFMKGVGLMVVRCHRRTSASSDVVFDNKTLTLLDAGCVEQ